MASGRLSRLTWNPATSQMVAGSEQVLINDWCIQFTTHSVGHLAFGPDGDLYASGGEGASYSAIDYGQFGGTLPNTTSPLVKKNPCGDPPGGAGGTESVPGSEGGSLRAQSPRRPAGQPRVLDGTIIRVNPATGAGLPDNPFASSTDANAKRIVAYGLRNPYRFTFRPGTSEVWIGNVGADSYESIDRLVSPTGTAPDFGWPCYEGPGQMTVGPNGTPGWQQTGLDMCTSLYNSPGAWTPPYYTYAHTSQVVPGESCPADVAGTAITGIDFYSGTSYPAAYNGALFFADYARNCMWAMLPGTNGLPNPANVITFDAGAASPVDIETGPNGDLFYADIVGGTIHRITATSGGGPTDLALGRPASASSSYSSAYLPGLANDGNSSTRWSSTFTDGQWWQVDLGSAQQVSSVTLNWETAYASQYKIQLSTDGTNFTDAATVSISAAGVKTTTFTPTTARYVRVLGVTRATIWGISLWDAQVFGPGGGGGSVPVNSTPPTISGLAQQGQTLSATTGTWTGSPTSFSYQWQRCNSSGASCAPISGAAATATYPLATADVGQTVRVAVTATNGSGPSQPANSAVTAVVTAVPTDLALGRPASASSSYSSAYLPGLANDGNSSTRWSSTFTDGQWWQVDLGSAQQVSSVTLNWETAYASQYKIQLSTDGTNFTDAATVSISAAGVKTTTFTPTTARYVRVLGVTRATIWGISLWDAQVFGPGGGGGSVPVNSTPPTISGLAQQGQTLSATTGTWTGSPTSFSYQWQRCNSSGASCAPISGAAATATYPLATADVGQTVRVAVTATNGSGPSQPANSAVTAVVTAVPTDLALGRPASASSSYSSAYLPGLANDGNSSTRWSSTFTDGQWWQVDLGSAQQVSSVTLNWETAYASQYKIQLSTDGTNFTDAATVSISAAGVKTTTFTPTTARYVRVLGVTRATIWGISLWDAQVFGP